MAPPTKKPADTGHLRAGKPASRPSENHFAEGVRKDNVRKQASTLSRKALEKRLSQIEGLRPQAYLLRAIKHQKEYEKMESSLALRKAAAQKSGQFLVPEEPKLVFVIRIKGIMKIPPKPRKIMQLFRLYQIHNGTFLKLSMSTLKMLRMIEPYVTWGYPSLDMVKRLIYQRGFAKLGGERIKLYDNEIIQRGLSKYNIVCMEDLVHEIFTVGPHFKEANNFLWTFKLRTPNGSPALARKFKGEQVGPSSGWRRRKFYHYIVGGDTGNREVYINQLLHKML